MSDHIGARKPGGDSACNFVVSVLLFELILWRPTNGFSVIYPQKLSAHESCALISFPIEVVCTFRPLVLTFQILRFLVKYDHGSMVSTRGDQLDLANQGIQICFGGGLKLDASIKNIMLTDIRPNHEICDFHRSACTVLLRSVDPTRREHLEVSDG